MKKNLPLFITLLCILLLESCRKDVNLTWFGSYQVHDSLAYHPMTGGTNTVHYNYVIGIRALEGQQDSVLVTNLLKTGDARTFTAAIQEDTIFIPEQRPNPLPEHSYTYSIKGYRKQDTIFFWGAIYSPIGDMPTEVGGIAVRN